MKRFIGIAILISLLTHIHCQNISKDSLILTRDVTNEFNTTTNNKKTLNIRKELNDSVIKSRPSPTRVVWMGAIIPGYGQILNRSYWKVPLVYAGYLGCYFIVSSSSKTYESYRSAYRDIIDDNPKTDSYLDILPAGTTLANYPGGESGLKNNLSSAYQQSRRNRDLTIIGSIAYYGIVLLEAYVDAQLFDFDISTDLSLHIRPTLLDNKLGMNRAAGFQLSLNLK